MTGRTVHSQQVPRLAMLSDWLVVRIRTVEGCNRSRSTSLQRRHRTLLSTLRFPASNETPPNPSALLVLGREFVIREAAIFNGQDISVADQGIYEAMRMAQIENIQILTTVPHSSLRKAASIIGIGRLQVRDVSLPEKPHRFDLQALRSALSKPKVASIVAVSCAEVNTGFFATQAEEMEQIRKLCDQYGAWIHVDAAFGLLARCLPRIKEYEALIGGVRGLELADSITGDAHKLLNVVGHLCFYLRCLLPFVNSLWSR